MAITLAAILGDVTGIIVTQHTFKGGLPSNPHPLYLEGSSTLLIYLGSYIILYFRSEK